jgi:tetratricopeptide (TPR) repeat protein
MPRLQDLERFKRDLAALSHEAEILERWGEKPEVIPPPDGAPAAPSQAATDKPNPPLPGTAVEDEGLPPDFAALLDNLPIDHGEPEAGSGSVDDELAAFLAAPEEKEGPPEPSAMPDFEAPTFAAEPSETDNGEVGIGEGDLTDFVLPDLEESVEAPPSEAGTFEEKSPELPEETAIPESPETTEDFSTPDLGAGFEETMAPEAGPALEADLSLGEPGTDGDAFETFNFEEPGTGLGDSGFGGSAPGGGAGRDLDTEIASLSEEAPAADTFKIDRDWGDFGSLGAGGASEAPSRKVPPKAPPRAKSAAPEPSEEKFRPVSLSEAQADRLQDSLLSFPLNLRVAIEDILANGRGSEAQQSKLVWALVDGVGAEDIADLAGRVLKRRIPIPKGREKRTGAALEAEKGSLAYAFVHTFLPVIKIGLLVLAVAAALGYLGWRFVYVPLASDSLYRRGYQHIAEDRYPEAETDFAKATEMREFINWYYRYADAYAAKRQYILAEKKYAALIDAHPKERKGIIAWARLEKEQLKFEEAVEVLKGAARNANGKIPTGKTGLLSWDYFNEEGLLLLGDVYLDWSEEAPVKYEDARRTYAFLIERYGYKDLYLERMLLYFIRTDRLSEVLPLKAHFLADPERTDLDAAVLAELGGYLLDKDILEDVRAILLTAAKKDPAEPEAHYHLARYFRRAGDPTEERKSLDNAVRSFSALPGLGGRRTGMYIDSLIWRARFLARAKEWLSAERDYATAATAYEKALELRRVKRGGRFGEAYAGLADVAYWQRDDLASALALYGQAAANGFTTADTSYKRGNILYRTGRYAESLEQFFEAGAGNFMSPYLAYAFGSALYARNDLFSAEAYFRKASAAMEKELADVGEPAPQERPSEIEILKLYIQSENNLGVALYRSAARSGDARRRNQAMTALTHAVRLYDQLSQAPSALEGAEPRNLGLKNMNTLLKTGRGEGLLVYSEIEKDMRYPKRG